MGRQEARRFPRAGQGEDWRPQRLPRLSNGRATPHKGRSAYPQKRSGPDLTLMPVLRTMVPMRRRRLPIVVLAALVLVTPAGAANSSLAKKLARALAVP